MYGCEVPPVRFDVSPETMADLERLAWSDTLREPFLLATRERNDSLPPMLDGIHMMVNGSSNAFGAFSFESRFVMNEAYASQATYALRTFISHNGGTKADSDGDYFLVSTEEAGKVWYALRVEDDGASSSITVRTVGTALSHDRQAEAPSPYQSPSHGVQSVGYAAEDFLDINEQVIASLYQYFDVRSDDGIRLACRRAIIRQVPEQLMNNGGERTGPMFSDIGGYDDIKQLLMEAVAGIQSPELFEDYGIEQHQSGILLYGKGGTGKTTLLEALANEIGAELRVVKATDIYGKWLGESEKNMDKVFDEAEAARGPYMLLFDELESIVGKSSFDASQRVIGLFKQRSARLASNNPHVVLAATINDRDKVDDTVVRAGRFDIKQYVPLPDETTRQQIFAHFVERHIFRAQRDVFAFDIDYEQLAWHTDELSGADIAGIMRAVVLRQALQERNSGHPPAPAGTEAIVAAINFHKRNLS